MSEVKNKKKKSSIIQVSIGVLAVILAILIIIMMGIVSDIQGTARIVNYTGLVRGETQRIIKLEVAGEQDDAEAVHQLQRHLHFVLVVIDMLQNHGVGLFLDLFFQYLDHLAEERVVNTFDQYCNCLGILTFQVSGTVVGYVVILFDHPHDHFLGLRIDVRVVIYGTGYRADTDTADSCDVFDRDFLHGAQTFPSLRTYLPYSFVILRIRPASSFVKSPFPILHFQLMPSVEGMLMRASDPSPR